MKYSLMALVIGFLIDLVIGDPHSLYHPIRLVGNLIGFLEKKLNKKEQDETAFLRGLVMMVLVILISGGVPFGLLWLAGVIHPYLRLALESIMCWQLLATKSLKDESMKVYDKLKESDLEGAREAVSMIVGRDTANLDEAGVTKAAVETIAENTSDGIIAPMFYMVMGGAVFGWIYKAINTMDSMVGYKSERYMRFGTAPARLDDVVNFIPARLAGLLMIAASFAAGYDGKQAYRIFIRDRYNHASPNSAQTEAVMAGALGVMLAGDAWYFGKLHKKKTIGDDKRLIEAEDIVRANRLLYITAFLAMAVFLAVRLMVLCLL